MEKTITPQELRSSTSRVLAGVSVDGDSYIIERRGRQEAAIVPLHVYEAYKRELAQLGALMERVAARNAGRDPAEIEASVQEAITETRAAKRQRR